MTKPLNGWATKLIIAVALAALSGLAFKQLTDVDRTMTGIEKKLEDHERANMEARVNIVQEFAEQRGLIVELASKLEQNCPCPSARARRQSLPSHEGPAPFKRVALGTR